MFINNKKVEVYSLSNKLGTTMEILNLGASLYSFKTRGKNDEIINVIVGPKDVNEFSSDRYLFKNNCFGASIGRYAGRISNGRFSIGDVAYSLYQEDGVHLHGGLRGLQHKIWKLEDLNENQDQSITLSCFSKDGDEGYPGNLKVWVTYTLTQNNELIIEYKAETNAATPVNLTNHAYFNLKGEGCISDHELYIKANSILEVDDKLRPTGTLKSLDGNAKNFLKKKKIGSLFVDDTFVLQADNSKKAITLYSGETGIEMNVTTNQPGVVVYIPKELPNDWDYQTEISSQFPSICLETQNFPDAPNHDNFPNSILKPNEQYLNRTVFEFKVK